MDSLPKIHYLKGVFIIFSEQDAMILRRKRIVGHLIGCAPKNPHQIVTSGLPYLISHYTAATLYLNKLAEFKELKSKNLISPDKRAAQCSERLSRIQDESRREFEEKRVKELRKRNIEPSPSRLHKFDDKKLRLTIQTELDADCSSFEAVPMDPSNLFIFTDHKMIVFKDLYDRGFFVSSGMKFGSDFLVYFGDPVRYHAQYAVRIVANIEDRVNITEVNYNEINALHRLCHTAKKTSLLAVVRENPEIVNYWTLKDREYLTAESDNTIFESIDPILNSV